VIVEDPLLRTVLDQDLKTAADAGDAAKVRALLAEGADPAFVTESDNEDATALMCAAYKGRAEVCRILIVAGAPVDQVNKSFKSALWYAAYFAHKDCCRVLLEKGADPQMGSKEHDSPYEVAACSLDIPVFDLLLERVEPGDRAQAYRACLEEVMNMHVYHSIKLRADTNGSPNWEAPKLPMVRHLISLGVDVNAPSKDGTLLLIQAVRDNTADLVAALLEAGPVPGGFRCTGARLPQRPGRRHPVTRRGAIQGYSVLRIPA
jgi:ankyrin repeat protein